MSDHERIWLQAADDAAEYGRLWCQDKVWPDHPDDSEPTEYVRADLVSQARAEGRREGQIAERERMQRKEMRRAVTWLHGFAAQMNDPHAKQVINLAADEYGRETATAIRALAKKEGGKDG